MLTLSRLKQRLQTKDELIIALVGTKRMRALNQFFLRHSGATDVLTFNYMDDIESISPDGTRIIGEIVICVAYAAHAALTHNTSLSHEIILYVAHGILHLSGYDDNAPPEQAWMRQQEKRLLAALSREDLSRDIFYDAGLK